MDIEGFVRSRIDTLDENELKKLLATRIKEYKDINDETSLLMAQSVIDEVSTTLKVKTSDDEFLKEITEIPKANVTMGKMGVGSRGSGDFFVHRRIAEIVSSTNVSSEVNPQAQDDGGVVKVPSNQDDFYITTAVDGVHSRLSDYPFLGGFHVTRATLRDVCVMGADPVSILSDLHLADDGDVGKLFDFTAGVCTVCELVDVPLVAGSTLRVGGDMVIGNRLVSAVGSVGVSPYPPTARKGATDGDIILMTEGAGGGTITTTALYNGYFDVVWDTLNVSFIKASNALFNNDLIKDIHAMTDVTNGGLRGDAHEISGVSTDSLMLIVPPEISDDVIKSISNVGVKIDQIGVVDNKSTPRIIEEDGSETTLVPQFREAAYTKIKKLVGDTTPEDFEKMKEKVQKAADESIRKKEKVIDYILKNSNNK